MMTTDKVMQALKNTSKIQAPKIGLILHPVLSSRYTDKEFCCDLSEIHSHEETFS